MTRGPDARRHFPAYVAGQIYRSLKHRFGMTGGDAALPYANTPRPKINPNAAAELADEEREDEAAEMIDDATAGAAAGSPAGNGAKSVIMTVPQSKRQHRIEATTIILGLFPVAISHAGASRTNSSARARVPTRT